MYRKGKGAGGATGWPMKHWTGEGAWGVMTASAQTLQRQPSVVRYKKSAETVAVRHSVIIAGLGWSNARLF